MSHNDFLWKVRCTETGSFVGDCGCIYCFDEFSLDELDPDDFDFDIHDEDDPYWFSDTDEDEDFDIWENEELEDD